jgi:NADH dehydrogenase (ubiquinone) Fe-S protein 3
MSFQLQLQNQNTLKYLSSFLPILASDSQDTSLVISVRPEDLAFTLKVLKIHTNTQYTVLSSISGVDYPERSRRFEVSYDLLSVKFNSRIRVKTFVDEITPLESVVSVYPCATWWEREVWDMFGVFFDKNSEIKRILTDYGFEGHPLRKDFPLSGFVESRYDDSLKRVVCEPLENAQEFRSFDFSSGWSENLIK